MNKPTLGRRTLVGLAALATLSGLACTAQAQSYPNRPVKIVVPFAAGGPADNYARFLAQRLGGLQGDGIAKRSAHERCRAGRGDGHRQDAGQEGVHHRVARLQAG